MEQATRVNRFSGEPILSDVVIAEDRQESHLLLSQYQQQLAEIVPADDVTEQRALMFIKGCREQAVKEEADRVRIVKPLNAEVDKVNAVYKPLIAAWESCRDTMTLKLNQYREKKRQALAEQQRKLIEDANRQKAEADKKAEALRVQAEAERQSGNESAAIKLEGKAEKAEMQAATITPAVVETVKKTETLLDGSKVTFKTTKTWLLPGFDRAGKLYANDERLDRMDLAFFRRFCVVDPTRLNAAVKSGERLPLPFQVVEQASSQIRQAKEESL